MAEGMEIDVNSQPRSTGCPWFTAHLMGLQNLVSMDTSKKKKWIFFYELNPRFFF